MLEAPADYLFNLLAMNSSDAKRMWRAAIKEQWDNRCAYCGSDHNLTLDHIHPKTKGGNDRTSNVVPACRNCNQSKGSSQWLSWFRTTDNFDIVRCNKILSWSNP